MAKFEDECRRLGGEVVRFTAPQICMIVNPRYLELAEFIGRLEEKAGMTTIFSPGLRLKEHDLASYESPAIETPLIRVRVPEDKRADLYIEITEMGMKKIGGT